jgi:hypothetical protein
MNKLQAMSTDIDELKAKSTTSNTFADLVNKSPRSSKRNTGGVNTLVSPLVKRVRVNTLTNIMGTGAAKNEIRAIKWLYISMLHPATKEISIVKLLSTALKSALTDFNCVKLVSKNMPTPTFISFKIGMPDDLFERSMDPIIWPSGVAIREIVDRRLM